MYYKKPNVSLNEAKSLINQIFKKEIQNIDIHTEDQIAQTFSFTIDEKKYYIHFNDHNMSQGTKNEIFFSNQFSKNNIPIRKIIKVDNFKNYNYSITERIKGQAFHLLTEEKQIDCLNSVFDVLINISKIKIDDTTGYGLLDNEYNGRSNSWSEHILQIQDEEPGFFYGNWHNLFNETFLEKKIFDNYYFRMRELLFTIKERRQLLHSGLGYGNVLIDGNEITAILNWGDARYGDLLFDLAYLLIWRSLEFQNKILQKFNTFLQLKNIKIENIINRVNCYKYYTGLDCMRYFAKTNNEEAYNQTKSVLESIE